MRPLAPRGFSSFDLSGLFFDSAAVSQRGGEPEKTREEPAEGPARPRAQLSSDFTYTFPARHLHVRPRSSLLPSISPAVMLLFAHNQSIDSWSFFAPTCFRSVAPGAAEPAPVGPVLIRWPSESDPRSSYRPQKRLVLPAPRSRRGAVASAAFQPRRQN